MVPTALSTLLSLPREISDIMLRHARADIAFLWQLSQASHLPPVSGPLTVRNVPMPALFLFNKQLRNEYLYNIKDLRLRATLDLEVSRNGWIPASGKASHNTISSPRILGRIDSITLLIRFQEEALPTFRNVWGGYVVGLMDGLIRYPKQIEALRLVHYYHQYVEDAHQVLGTQEFQDEVAAEIRQIVPEIEVDWIFGFRVASRGQGSKVDCAHGEGQPSCGEEGGVLRARNEEVVRCRVTRVAMWLFERDERSYDEDGNWIGNHSDRENEDHAKNEVGKAQEFTRECSEGVLALLDGEKGVVRMVPHRMRE